MSETLGTTENGASQQIRHAWSGTTANTHAPDNGMPSSHQQQQQQQQQQMDEELQHREKAALMQTPSPGAGSISITSSSNNNSYTSSNSSSNSNNYASTNTGNGTRQKNPTSLGMAGFLDTSRSILLSSYVNVLLIFVPIGIALGNLPSTPKPAVFAVNCVAIIPLAGLLSLATEMMAARRGAAIGALMNVTFGNTVELIIFIIALVKDEVRIVQASLLGSILANLLLILGMCFLLGGMRFREQVYNATATQTMACLLSLSVISLVLPTAFHLSFQDNALAKKRDAVISRMTSIVLLLVYILYLIFQLKTHSYMYQSVPQDMIDEESQPGPVAALLHEDSSSECARDCDCGVDESSSRAASRRRAVMRVLGKGGSSSTAWKTGLGLGQTPSAPGQHGSASPVRDLDDFDAGDLGARPAGSTRHPLCTCIYRPSPSAAAHRVALPPGAAHSSQPKALGSFKPGDTAATTGTATAAAAAGPPNAGPADGVAAAPRRTSLLVPATHPSAEHAPALSTRAAGLLLVASTGLVAYCAELMVSSMSAMLATSPPMVGEAFIGLIVLPVVGNAAEHVTALTVALRNKMDLAIAVAVGSSIQIALFVTPSMVMLGWALERDMTLRFTLFETVCLFLATFIVAFLVLDGRSNYLEGALLLAAYVIVSVVAFYYPAPADEGVVAG